MEIKHFEEYDCVYDENNNLIEVYENQILTCKYKYNSHSKVIREDNLLLNVSIVYKYNEFDKLLQRTIYDYTLQNLQNVKFVDNFEYDYENQNRIISYNDESFIYDKNGNPLMFRNAKINLSNQNLLELESYSFTYDKNNCRTSKVIGEATTMYYRKYNKLIKQDNGAILYFTYKNNKINGFKYNNENYVYKKNYNDDIVGIYNSNKILICRYVYDCFGNHKLMTNNKSDEKIYEIADINPFRFHSNYFDIETGLYFINGKYYDSEVDCFINN